MASFMLKYMRCPKFLIIPEKNTKGAGSCCMAAVSIVWISVEQARGWICPPRSQLKKSIYQQDFHQNMHQLV
jgi:hypothetical protein